MSVEEENLLSNEQNDWLGPDRLQLSDSDNNDDDKQENLNELQNIQIYTEEINENQTNFDVKENLPPEAGSEITENPSIKPVEKEIPRMAMSKMDEVGEPKSLPWKKNRLSALIDPDSEEESKSPAKMPSAILSDGESKDSSETNRQRPSKQRSRLISSSASEDEDQVPPPKGKKICKSKISALIDSDDSQTDLSDHAAEEEDESQGDQNEPKMGNERAVDKKTIRASAKKALNDIQTIQSEQQRLHREMDISIPYHKPKKYTLQEFLKRRTIINPTVNKSNSPAGTGVRGRSLKMSTEELEEYAKLMEERAREAAEFFKSESEDDEETEEEMKFNEGVMDKIENEKEQKLQETNEGETVIPLEMNNKSVRDTDLQSPTAEGLITASNQLSNEETRLQSKEELRQSIEEATAVDEPSKESSHTDEANNLSSILENTDNIPSTSKAIVTEIIELPKLDLSSVHLTANEMAPTSPSASPSPLQPPTSLSPPEKSLALDNVQRLITEKILPESPSIRGDSNMLIDLETGDLIPKEPNGADNLLHRLLDTRKCKTPKTTETLNILSTENGKVEISKVDVHVEEDYNPNKEQKPGAAYLKLKENLKSLIRKKRLEGLQKKQEEEKEFIKCLDDDDDEFDEDEENEEYEPEDKPKLDIKDIIIDDEENAIDLNEEDNDLPVDNEEDDYDLDNDENNLNIAENEDDNDEDDNTDGGTDDDSNDSDDEDGLGVENKNGKSKNRIIKAFADDSDSDEDQVDFPHLQESETSTIIPNAAKLFESESRPCNADAENELLELCSGQFDGTQKSEMPIISQIPVTQMPIDHDGTQQLLELCSGTFEDAAESGNAFNPTADANVKDLPIESPKRACKKILSSDEENANNDHEVNVAATQRRNKKLTKKMKKGKPKLGFSDDEQEEEEEENAQESVVEILKSSHHDENSNSIQPEVEPKPESNKEVDTFIDYDSEENEVVVKLTKGDHLKNAEDFFENEAELSESDWGSADEDEKNMDKYDIELGDEDEFDREKLRTELGQIHARKMLDEDIREVRKIQEMLFEDEETDGVGRQRQFRWKNAESGFSLNDSYRKEGEEGNGESGDEENEHLWRKIRFEREQLLKEHGLMESSQEYASKSLMNASDGVVTVGSVKKINIISTKKVLATKDVENKKSSPFLISTNRSAMAKLSARGSFLKCDKETLTKLAGLTKAGSGGATNDDNGTGGTVSVKNAKARNFVFATLTEEEHENLKRKADELLNSSSEQGVNYIKKPRQEPRRERCLIDQLL